MFSASGGCVRGIVVRNLSELLASVKAALALRKESAGLSTVGCCSRLLPPDHFDAAIRLERARVDRNEHVFSLVVFEAGDLKANSAFVRALTRSLSDRIRSTDEIGWVDDSRVGVLLPYTPPDGARKFVEDVVRATDSGATWPSYTIYSYPPDEHGGNGQGRAVQLNFADISNKWNPAEPHMFGIPRLHLRGGHVRSAVPAHGLSAIADGPSTRSPLPAWKRIMDIAGSLLGLALACPFLLIHMVILKAVSPGPVFFKQKRIGYMGRQFEMWKLRTMHVNADPSFHRRHVSQLINGDNGMDSDRPMVKLDDNPHIIPGGIILRKTCIDEIPQLINVLRGEMSLVGPRPPLAYEVERFLEWQHRRFDAVPGMTGLWQVSGKNRLTFAKMIRLDIQYSRRRSFLLDLMILLKTPLAIVSQIRDSLVLQRKQPLMVESKHV